MRHESVTDIDNIEILKRKLMRLDNLEDGADIDSRNDDTVASGDEFMVNVIVPTDPVIPPIIGVY